MALPRSRKPRRKSRRKPSPRRSRPARLGRWLRRWVLRGVLAVIVVPVLVVALFSVVNPPMGVYMRGEADRLGGVERTWVPMERIAPVMARSAVAAEDANFCAHWGIDVDAMRAAIASGGARGGSTISQQTVKNVFLWHGRSYVRKGLEAALTPVVELVWSKRRILEVYLNVAEFDTGVFGVEAAARHYFGVSAAALDARQASRLAAILPSPKRRSASAPSSAVRARAAQIRAGAATIAADGRAECFER
ncbi:monofunctional biosynthetic peptidoglycan transglycosylase [Pseudaestuariivita sp.]|uniref:monofunctional biosynthetic peptidoglycan transglycosylase n=1 Tax=Pseudaestuariivita sp. TaxID=2211669 RepID=UPI00405840F3